MANRPSGLDECFRQGAKARQDGRKLADNPYDIETDDHTEWAAGWRATLDLDEDRDAASTRIDAGDTGETRGLHADHHPPLPRARHGRSSAVKRREDPAPDGE